MESYKRLIHSDLLNRTAHADVFKIGNGTAFLFVLFGGSGVNKGEYERRARSVIPLFEQVLDQAARIGMSFTFIHATSPYDVPLRRFAEEPDAARDVAPLTVEG